MTDLDQLLPLWRDLKASGVEYVLGTVVAVEGSGYRKPGARMLLASDGRRAGTISGGNLEQSNASTSALLVSLIQYQQAYQANTSVIQTEQQDSTRLSQI